MISDIVAGASNDKGFSNKDDYEEQKSEIETLHMILEDKFECFHDPDPTISFELQIMVDLNPEESVAIHIVVSDEGEPSKLSSSCKATVVESFTVEHLLPVGLLALLPYDYPSTSKPVLSLRCPWLSMLQAQLLQAQLNEIVDESDGDTVIFQCASFLQTEAWRFLGLEDAIHLVMKPDAPNIFSVQEEEGFNVEEVRGMIIDYNRREKRRIFTSSIQSCAICLDEKLGKLFEFVFPCNHFYCRNCLSEHCKLHIKEGSVQNLQCPTPKCPNQLNPSLIKMLVDDEAYSRYDRLTLQKALDGMSDVVICPIKSCQASVIEDSKDCFALCPEVVLSRIATSEYALN
jgi:hypothetical protein